MLTLLTSPRIINKTFTERQILHVLTQFWKLVIWSWKIE
jgi:hypothetical protein